MKKGTYESISCIFAHCPSVFEERSNAFGWRAPNSQHGRDEVAYTERQEKAPSGQDDLTLYLTRKVCPISSREKKRNSVK